MPGDALAQMDTQEVLVRQWPGDILPPQYFRLVDRDAHVVVGSCGHLYDELEYDAVSYALGYRPLMMDAVGEEEGGGGGRGGGGVGGVTTVAS